MQPEKTSTRTPKLRFPEFQDAGEWEEKQLEGIASFFKGKGISKADIDLQGETPCIRYGELYTIYNEVIKTVFSKTKLPVSELFLSQKMDVLIPSSGETKLDIAKASCVLHSNVALGGDLNILRSDDNGVFLSYLLNGPYKREIAKKAQGDTVVHLYANQLKLLEVMIPKREEQQRIADCLTSLDDLISAHSKKLDALKEYKQGLLQQLFPAAGETVPRLRFPEFQDAGEWEDINLGKLGTTISGLTYSPSDIRNNGLLVLRSSNIKDGVIVLDDCVYVTKDIKGANLSKPNDILICVRNGSTSLIGKNALIPEGMPLCTHGAFMTVFRTEMPRFVYQLFQTEAYQNQVAADLGARINSINNNRLINYRFLVPSLSEQQRIADCLTSIDNMITTQSQKLDALKTHKQGLMQQLFPSADEVPE